MMRHGNAVQPTSPPLPGNDMSRQRRPKRPAPCASCQTVTDELIPHKQLRDGIVVREKICTGCYFRALKAAVADGDMAWARLNDEVRTLQDTVAEQRAEQRELAWRADKATERQLGYLNKLASARNLTITEPENLTKGEASDLIDDIQCRPIARICANCKEEFQARPDKHRKYCDTCSRLTPAQRRKLMAETSSVVH